MKQKVSELTFSNIVIDKSQLKQLIVWAFRNYGIARAANMADKLKDLGFHYATKAGISLSLEDLRIPPSKKSLLATTMDSIANTDSRYKKGQITAVERFQKVIDTWNNASETLKQEVVQYFKNTDPLNSIYMMAFSGARGNISQVRQLVGMRGLMADPQGQIIDLPIASNFREGLTITDYFISSYGARKGLVDTALRTADSGYLTRRLVDVAQDVIVREIDCKTSKGILLQEMVDNHKMLISLEQALLGRVLAEDVLDPISHIKLASARQYIDPVLANKIALSGLNSVLVRSPITCNSIRSVCQLCYGWNLAHGKMVDLGEAIGIIAAQSIGEPGTQLTMRTFHTGGVFTGELAQTITSHMDSKVEYTNTLVLSNTRTRHGDDAFIVNKDCKIKQVDNSGSESFISLPKETLILVKDGAFVKKGQIIAEYPLSNRIITERAQKAVVTDFSGSVYFSSDLSTETIQNKQNTFCSVTKGGIIWVLSGKVYHIPDNAQLMISGQENIYEEHLLARTQLICRYDGYVNLSIKQDQSINQEICIVTSSKTFIDMKVSIENNNGQKGYILETERKDRFLLKIINNQKIDHNQIVAELMSNVYKTKTGGIIKYLDLPVSKKQQDSNKSFYDILGAGYILWISEETHEINKDISLLLVKHGDFIESGTEIIKNIFAKNSGILEVIQKDGIIREIIIKPGIIYSIYDNNILKTADKSRGFLRPGEVITENIIADKLVYWEHIQAPDKKLLLIRPVIVYSVPHKVFDYKYTDDSFKTDIFNLQLVRRINFRDGERVKSVNGINLINTYLIAKLKEDSSCLNCTAQFKFDYPNLSYSSLKFITADILSIRDSSMSNDEDIYTKTRILVENNQYVTQGQIIAQTEMLASTKGKVESIKDRSLSNRRILIIGDMDVRTFILKKDQLIYVKVHDWIYSGDIIATDTVALDSGRIIDIEDNKVTMRIGRPYLISNGSILHVDNSSLVQRGENIATLIFERAKTGDIVQGLPRIEEILEARKKSDNTFNPHAILESNFRAYLSKGLSLYDATRLSFLDVQLCLVKEVQLVYQSQGVDIGDKHIEVIVRQMTSKVKIENGGDSDYLPGEIIELQKIESVNKLLSTSSKKEAVYHPILLGITKASLNTESFISAASFQETTKVLTEAAISGKLDWLRGLKENVIIGRLIPAGTGFNIYNNSISNDIHIPSVASQQEYSASVVDSDSISSKLSFDDIILDDRSARNYPVDFNSTASYSLGSVDNL